VTERNTPSGAPSPDRIETGASGRNGRHAETRFGLARDAWDAAVQKAVTESTTAQQLPLLIENDTALTTIADIVEPRHPQHRNDKARPRQSSAA